MEDEIQTTETAVEETPVVETPEEEVAEEPVSPEPVLYDLPDGRKVDAETLQKEWKDNFLPDYTRKSQELSELKKVNTPDDDVPAWKKDDYTPKTYAELIEIAKQEAIQDLQNQALQEDARIKEVATLVDTQIADIKKNDPTLDENALFLHANKYGFRDLKLAHDNFKAIQDAKLSTEQRVLKNAQTRAADPVAGKPGTQDSSDAMVYGAHGKFGSALEFLQSQK